MPRAPAFLVVACMAAGIAAGCGSPRAELEPKELDRAARQLVGVASEAALFAAQVRDGAVTRNFAWVHQQALVEEAQQAAQALFKPVPPALRSRHEQLVGLATRLEVSLDRIAGAAGDRAQLAGLERALGELKDRAAALEDAR